MSVLTTAIGLHIKDGAQKVKMVFKKKPIIERPDYPLDITRNSAIEIETLQFEVNDNILVPTPPERLFVQEIGIVQIEDDIKLYRFYCDDFFLEMTEHGDKIEDIRLFGLIDVYHPQSYEELIHFVGSEEDDEYESHEGIIGDPIFQTQDGVQYHRVFCDQYEGNIDPVEMTEYIYTHDWKNHSHVVEHKCMLFLRDADDHNAEFLSVSSKDFGDSGGVYFYRGIQLSPSTFDVYSAQ